MADLKISQLPAAGALTGTELVELVQSSGNVRTTVQDIADLAPGAPPVVPDKQIAYGDPTEQITSNGVFTFDLNSSQIRQGLEDGFPPRYARHQFLVSVETPDNTPFELQMQGGGPIQVPFTEFGVIAFRVMVSAGGIDGSDAAAFFFEGALHINVGGGNAATLIGVPAKVGYKTAGASSWDCAVAAENAASTIPALKITVTGDAVETVNWSAAIDFLTSQRDIA